MNDKLTIDLTEKQAEKIRSALMNPATHTPRTPEKGFPPCAACEVEEKIRAALDDPQPPREQSSGLSEDDRGRLKKLARHISRGEWGALHEVDANFLRKLAEQTPSGDAELRGRLLDDDGPFLLAVREAVATELEACGYRDEEGEPCFADGCEWIANEISNSVKKQLLADHSLDPQEGTNA